MQDHPFPETDARMEARNDESSSTKTGAWFSPEPVVHQNRQCAQQSLRLINRKSVASAGYQSTIASNNILVYKERATHVTTPCHLRANILSAVVQQRDLAKSVDLAF